MTVIVEDGSGKADAEVYISVADADAYHLKRGNAAWAVLDTTAKESALINAADYMSARYGTSWQGVRTTDAQALDWPRFGVYRARYAFPSDEVPLAVANANAELALRASIGSLMPDQERGGDIKRLKADVLEIEYQSGTPGGTSFPSVDGMLISFMNSGANNGTNVKLVRD